MIPNVEVVLALPLIAIVAPPVLSMIRKYHAVWLRRVASRELIRVARALRLASVGAEQMANRMTAVDE